MAKSKKNKQKNRELMKYSPEKSVKFFSNEKLQNSINNFEDFIKTHPDLPNTHKFINYLALLKQERTNRI